MLDLAVLILTYNTKDLTLRCLEKIFENKWKHKIGVWLLDNGSSDGSYEAISEKFKDVNLMRAEKNLGFSKGNNLVLKEVYKKARYIFLLNSDTEVLADSLDKLVDFAEKEKFDICSCKLLNPDGSFQPNGGSLPTPLSLFIWLSGLDDIVGSVLRVDSYQQRNQDYYRKNEELGWVSGTAILIKVDVFNKIGFLDDKIFMYGEDVDFCWRAKRVGFRVGWTDKAEIIHIGGASSLSPKFKQWRGELIGLLYLYKKYYGELAAIALKVLIYIFVSLRAIAFSLLGKIDYGKTYFKIILSI